MAVQPTAVPEAAGDSVPREDFVWVLGALCALERIPFDAALLVGQFPPPYSIEKLIAVSALRPGMPETDYNAALEAVEMTASERSEFIAAFSVEGQWSDAGTGFSATLFKSVNGGQFYFAIRGTQTEPFGEAILDAREDATWILSNGYARNQILSLYNTLSLLRTPLGQAAPQKNIESVAPSHPEAIATRTMGSYRIVDRNATIGQGLLAGSSEVTFVGHSLGGHLAMAAAALFPDLVGPVQTYNAPGFELTLERRRIEAYFTALTGSSAFPWQNMTHVKGEGLSAAATLHRKFGASVDVFIENTFGRLRDHSQVRNTDSLALYDLFGRIDSKAELTQVTGVLKAVSPKDADSLELALDALDFHVKRLALRRIDAQLADAPLTRRSDDPPEQFAQVLAQYSANRLAYQTALAQERATLEKAKSDRDAADAVRRKLSQVLPHYHDQEAAYAKLQKDGFAGRLMYTDKQRERIEKEQDLVAQEAIIASAAATIALQERKIAQISADYRRQLQTERVDIANQFEKSSQELAKQEHRHGSLELRAPQAGLVKDLATHTIGTVASPGTILMTLVPKDDKLRAEVWVKNDDIGFVRKEQPVKVKLAAFTFQKYGMVQGTVAHVSADAAEQGAPAMSAAPAAPKPAAEALAYRTLVDLKSQTLEAGGVKYRLTPGMQVAAEIHLGTRSVLEYLLSPVQKAFHEAGRER